ncbi:TetR/AcrR family transcriptional regulator [Achromobacter sp. AGC78]|uniref:TetR/AcrR family transcriptional regulator n=1 Tax=Achromobacter spanius TaxID=217203 RepID=A0AA42LPI9_9BURK|nr:MULTISPECIES: TetR/AcrR family transcriptional regulator [Achromobacter]MDH0737130.1 TetR/AcrR family transcriptional regulator [Achromobacter spanius]
MTTTTPPRTGRRTRADASLFLVETRDLLIRVGMELLTERGFTSTGLDAILKRATVPKGSFYHYFKNKEDFGHHVMQAYDEYFRKKLDRWLLDGQTAPLQRLQNFVEDAKHGMARHGYTRGCLIGNFGQEVGALPEPYRACMNQILGAWESRIATCLAAAQERGDIAASADCQSLSSFFWIGWEGAVLRAKMMRKAEPMDVFLKGFLAGLPR